MRSVRDSLEPLRLAGAASYLTATAMRARCSGQKATARPMSAALRMHVDVSHHHCWSLVVRHAMHTVRVHVSTRHAQLHSLRTRRGALRFTAPAKPPLGNARGTSVCGAPLVPGARVAGESDSAEPLLPGHRVLGFWPATLLYCTRSADSAVLTGKSSFVRQSELQITVSFHFRTSY